MGRTGRGWGQGVGGVDLVPAKAEYPMTDVWEKARRLEGKLQERVHAGMVEAA